MLLNELSQKFGVDLSKIDPLAQLRAIMAWYPNKKLYNRVSTKSGKSIISVYHEKAICPVYSHEEWYADDWESPSLAIDLNKSFFAQFRKLQQIAPVVGLLSSMQENAEYCQDSEGLKNCYLVFDALNCQDVYYSARIYNSRDCVDVYWVMDSELLYDCVYMFNCYNARYSFNCHNVSDSAFLFNCRNVKHAFMCSGLRNKEYCIYNKQVTKEEYEAFVKEIKWSDYQTIVELKKKFISEVIPTSVIPPAFLDNCDNVEGNYLKNTANALNAFESFDLKDIYNVFQCAKGHDIAGAYMCNDRVEKCFQCVATGIAVYEVRNCAFVWHSSYMEYCYLCLNCQNCFGCIGLRNKQYHIFNKPYPKEEYEKRVTELKEKMKERGEYDQFFPLEMSPFPYEDTIASDLFDNKDNAVFAAEYVHIGQSITVDPAAVQICTVSGKSFRYITQELQFYTKHAIPLPRISPALRYRARMQIMDTSFLPQTITLDNGQEVATYFAHPQQKKIVSKEDYEKLIH
ncbi:MAG: hypothetical protein HY817_04880 [Candidatus Abawacabacteria bacterium]|nr:hypothetical protein [Candidatus Abawacabacteria bacterium]